MSTARLQALLEETGLDYLHGTFIHHGIDDAIVNLLTESDLRELGVERIGDRKRFLTALSRLPSLPGKSSQPTPPPTVEATSQRTPLDPKSAARDRPLVNSLDLPFIPVLGTTALFCIWQVRRRDYLVFSNSLGTDLPTCDFDQSPDDPVVNVTWNEAQQFCEWLTRKERAAGLISPAYEFALPSDLDWSAAVGLRREPGQTPMERSLKIPGYPWGNDFPPPQGVGNYHPLLGVDDYAETSPVGSFPPNQFGLHDLGGNVWEWCQDEFEPGCDTRVLRGASCFNDDPDFLKSSYRDQNSPLKRRNNNGFRLVLRPIGGEEPSWF